MQKVISYVRQNTNRFCLTAVLLFSVSSFLVPILFLGLPDGFDLAFDLRIATSVHEAITSGTPVPEWANDNFGFGSVGVRVYPLAAFYLLAIGKIITGSWLTSFIANLTLLMCIGCIGMYFFVKEWGTPYQAMTAGMIYAIVPQHLSEIYSYFLYAQYSAWAVIPFCFLFAARVCQKGKRRDVLLFALSYSVLILTHLPTTIIVSLCLPVYVLALMDWNRLKETVLNFSVSIGLTLAATAFRWSQIVTEANWISHNEAKWSTGKFGFKFWLFPNVLEPRTSYFFEMVSWLTDIIIVLTVLLLVPAIIYLFRSKINDPVRKIIMAATVTTLFAFFMLSKPSTFIWDNLDFLQKIQFPWRWLSVLSLLGIVSFVLAIPRLTALYQKFDRVIVYSGVALITAMALFDISQVILPSEEPMPKAQFEKHERELQTKPMFEAWWTTWAKEAAFAERTKVLTGKRTVDISKWEPTAREFTVGPGESVNLRIATFWYPLWKATVNGQPTNIEMDENGVMLISVPSASAQVSLKFEEPFLVKMSSWISLITWIFFAAALNILYRKEKIT